MESDSFNAWVSLGNKDTLLVKKKLKLRIWNTYSVDLQVTHCGLCGSDVHVLDGEWGPISTPYCCVGHEIVGIVTRVGERVTNVNVGDRVGVGPQCFSCLECPSCLEGYGNLCYKGMVLTFHGRWPDTDEVVYGGFADKWRGDARFVYKIPDGLCSKDAAAFLCAGGTVHAPMMRWNVSSESTVGVLGMGGLGHFAVLFAKAMGAKVVALSRGNDKRQVSMDSGCDDYVDITNKEEMERIHKSLTHIVCTGFSNDFAWEPFLATLKPNGVFIMLAASPQKLPAFNVSLFTSNQITFTGSIACSSSEMQQTLQFAADHDLKPWISNYPMHQVNDAIHDFKKGLARFRFVLEN